MIGIPSKFDFIETDKRILDQKLKRHQLSQQENQKILKGLPDEKELAEEIRVYEESAPSSSEEGA